MAYRLAREATDDLRGLWDYVATGSGSTATADRLIDRLIERIDLLAQFPEMGRRRDDDLRPGLRTSPVGQYVLIYRVEGPDVTILRVLHGMRDLPALLTDD